MALHGTIDKVKVLLGHKGNHELTDNAGRTALHYAAMHGKLDVMRALVDEGADVNQSNR